MSSRARSRRPASIGSNQSSRRWIAVSAPDCRARDFVLLLVMAWSPPARVNAGIVWVSAPGDYAAFNSNHTSDGTLPKAMRRQIAAKLETSGVVPQKTGKLKEFMPVGRSERISLHDE